MRMSDWSSDVCSSDLEAVQDMSDAISPLRVGIGGPVGSGKTALMDALCKYFRDDYDIAAITNDIYTREDAEFLTLAGRSEEGSVGNKCVSTFRYRVWSDHLK